MYTFEKASVVTARCIAGLLVIGGVFGIGISIVFDAQGAGVEPFAVKLGSSLLLIVGSETTESACGINVLALVSLFALLAMRSVAPVRVTTD